MVMALAQQAFMLVRAGVRVALVAAERSLSQRLLYETRGVAVAALKCE